MKNEHSPESCNSCWALAATSALSDRIKIMRNGKFPDIIISPQVLLSCDLENQGCEGGWGLLAYKWMSMHETTDETCSPYRARGHTNGIKCSNTTMCKDCGSSCFVPDKYNIYHIEEYGRVSGEEAMKQEIFQRGPIVCGIAVPEALSLNYSKGIFKDTSGDSNLVHEVSVVGYGVENGIKYWLVRNSWGSYWGEGGMLRVIRGINNIGIESECAFAVAKDTWTANEFHTTTEDEKNDPNNERSLSTQNIISAHDCRRINPQFSKGPRIYSPEPWTYLPPSSLPSEWDWRNVNGTNFASINKNQHIPVYCASCWAFATTSALSDRFQILNGQHALPVSLAPQVVINCQPGKCSCNGGNPWDAYEFMYQHGITDESCQQYTSRNSHEPFCTEVQVCERCEGTIPKEKEDGKIGCQPVVNNNYRKYYAKEYGHVKGPEKMKAEIYIRGPIECGIESTSRFHQYKTGIFSEHKDRWRLNHAISVVGWGAENGEEYWIGRNSWGVYWGDQGYFKMRMHGDNNGIETDCNWAVPSYEKPGSMLEEYE